MKNYIARGSLNVHKDLDSFLSDEVLIGLDLNPEDFWKKFEELLEEFNPVSYTHLRDHETSQHRVFSHTL